jgi:serine/threonine-protein kinase
MVGKTISHYRITNKLGSGGMGEVYQARDLNLDRFVALKFLFKELLLDEEARHRFKNEAKIISTLDHPNIATVYEIKEIDDFFFISIAYYEGDTLEKRLEQGLLPLDEIYSLGRQIASGLTAAHDAGVIHRDIKPSNVIITKKDQVKIIDFGLAKSLRYTQITEQDTTMGTMGYMSPEQIQSKAIDHRSDIFSLGVLLFTLITGKMPFHGEHSASIIYSILQEDPPSIRKLRSEVPEQLENLVFKALAKDPEQRFQSAGEMGLLLEAMQSGEAISDKIVIPSKKLSLVRRSWQIFVSIAVVAAIALFFLYRASSPTHSATNSIAVIPFDYEGEESEWQWLGAAVTDLIDDELEQYPALKKLNSRNRMQVIRKLGFSPAQLSLEQALQVARESKMNSVLIGSLKKVGNTLQVKTRVLNVNDNRLVVDFEPFENSYSKLDEIAARVSEQLMSTIANGYRKRTAASDRGRPMPASLDAFRYYIEGREAAYDLRYEEAISKLTNSLRFDSTFVKTYYFLEWVYSTIGDKAKAKEFLAKGKPFIDDLSEEARLHYLSVEAKLDRRWQAYLTYLKEMMRINPYEVSYHFDYGWTQYNIFHQVDLGIAAMEKSLQLDSTHANGYAYYGLAYANLEKGDKARALSMIDKYIALNPTKVNSLTAKAGILRYIGDYDGAILLCERVVAIQGVSSSASLSLARTYFALGKFLQALEVLENFNNAEHVKKSISKAQSLAAQAYFLQAKYNQALQLTEQAIAVDSINLDGHWLRGRTLVKLKDERRIKDQVSLLSRTLDSKGNLLKDKWLLYHLQGEVALSDGSFDMAIELFQKAVNLFPSDRSFYLMALANAYQQSGQYQRAVEIYQSALEFNPNNAKANYLLAKTYEELRKPGEALRYYEKVEQVWAGADETLPELEISKNRILALK